MCEETPLDESLAYLESLVNDEGPSVQPTGYVAFVTERQARMLARYGRSLPEVRVWTRPGRVAVPFDEWVDPAEQRA